jgi:hypothetical protein
VPAAGVVPADHPTAERFAKLLDGAGVPVAETLPWNAYPWYINRLPQGKELEDGVEPMRQLLGLLPRLQLVVLLGRSAQDGWRRLARRHPDLVTGLDVVPTYHTSNQAFIGPPEVRARRKAALEAVFAHVARSLAGALGITRMGVWGFSGGGSYALASAALLPDLVAGATVFASFAPYASPGLDFCEGMSPEYAAEVELFFTDRTTARQNWRQDAGRLFTTLGTPESWMAPWGDAAGSDDAPPSLWLCSTLVWSSDAEMCARARGSRASGRARRGQPGRGLCRQGCPP